MFAQLGEVLGVYHIDHPNTGVPNGTQEVFLRRDHPIRIPHILHFEKPCFNVLVTVKGRKPYCTKCEQVGHVRKNCSLVPASPESRQPPSLYPIVNQLLSLIVILTVVIQHQTVTKNSNPA